MLSFVPEGIIRDLESSDIITFSARPLISNVILLSADKTIGRADRLCGATGVNTKLSE